MRAIIGLTAILVSAVATAQPDYQTCNDLSRVSGKIMESRQLGVPLSEVLAMTDSDLMRSLVLDAWEVERWNSEKHQKLAITDFSDEVLKECLYATDDHMPKE